MLTDAQLAQPTLYLAVLVFADFDDLPIRGAFAHQPVTVPAGLADADADCAGFTFDPLDDNILQLGEIEQSRQGGGGVRLVLRVDPAATPELLTAINTPALYDGRPVKVWFVVHNSAGTALQIELKHVGYMVRPSKTGSANSLDVAMETEDWLAIASSGPRGGTYLEQSRFDPGDASAAATLGQGQQAPMVPYAPGPGDWHYQIP